MAKLLLYQTIALLLGFVLDFFIGDPYSWPHPVRAIGAMIAFLDKRLHRPGARPQTDRLCGVCTVLLVCTVSCAVPAAALWAAWRLHSLCYLVLNTVMCFQLLAARQLEREGRKVQRALEQGDVEGARAAVSMIVGRDTAPLDAAGICRAAVETVAENASDGVTAPLFWMFFFGAVGGFFYKAVNTMDSMLGYRNARYLHFGRAAAKLDDAVNFLPARLCALWMIALCPLLGFDARNAGRIFLRDRHKHPSPNSAQTESACAGALGIRLGGPVCYGGVSSPKPYIGDATRPIEPGDIAKASRLMYGASILMLALILLIRGSVIVRCF